MHWLSSNEKYSGNWLDNFQSGFGTHIWLDQSADNKLLRNRYVGYWLNGLRHGKGTFYYSNGSKYEGDWAENFKHGQGIFTFEDGTEYDGPFEKDRMINRKIDQPSVAEQSPSKQPAPKAAKDPAGVTQDSLTKNMRATHTESVAGKVVAGPKEVEQNPFKKLIDITDLMDFEMNPTEVEKEC